MAKLLRLIKSNRGNRVVECGGISTDLFTVVASLFLLREQLGDKFGEFGREDSGGSNLYHWCSLTLPLPEGTKRTLQTTSPQSIRPTVPHRLKYGESSTNTKTVTPVIQDNVTISRRSSFRAAMVLAIIADALQIVVFPLFVQGALSPADDILDVGVGALLVQLLGWHWEFLPSFLAKLIPGVDLVPFWTMAVANVYRKSKRITSEESHEEHPNLRDSLGS